MNEAIKCFIYFRVLSSDSEAKKDLQKNPTQVVFKKNY